MDGETEVIVFLVLVLFALNAFLYYRFKAVREDFYAILPAHQTVDFQ